MYSIQTCQFACCNVMEWSYVSEDDIEYKPLEEEEDSEDEQLASYMKLVDKAINAYIENTLTLFRVPEHLLQYIPEALLVHIRPHDIDCVWDKQPSRLTSSVHVQNLRMCDLHYRNRGKNGIDWDGPNPMRIDCYLCRNKCQRYEDANISLALDITEE